MATKEELRAELRKLGIKADKRARKEVLETLLANTKKETERITPNAEQPIESAMETERIKPEENKAEVEADGDEPEDYLRQYQYRQNTIPGSKESDPIEGSRAAVMKEILLKQPKTRIIVMRGIREDSSIKQSVTLNGYRLDFPKQVYIEVPEQIAKIIMESQEQTDQAIARDQIGGDKKKEEALL